ncbi:MAG: DUF6340 family protein [Candidatus Cyclobacteriaceae bacterium M2_1C_046]
MKTIPYTLFLLLLITLLGSCAKNGLTLSVTEPAPVTIPNYIEKVGVVNRTTPDKGNEAIDKIDKVLSMEGKDMDKEAAQQAVAGLYHELGQNTRFSEVEIIEAQKTDNPGMGVFPAPLSWEEVDRLCRENNVDALFTLAFYDTDANVAYNSVPVEIKGPLGVRVPALEHHVTITTFIKTGWRIYDPASRVILDEFIINDRQVSTGRGINPARAAEAVIGRKDAVLQVSNIIGSSYSARIMPYWVRVHREYFVKGTNNFKIAKRRAQTGDWDGAAELWALEVDNPKRKVAGRAHYNMAIINEINGDKPAALEWATKAYADYNIKAALDYINILKYRISRDQELEYQMH